MTANKLKPFHNVIEICKIHQNYSDFCLFSWKHYKINNQTTHNNRSYQENHQQLLACSSHIELSFITTLIITVTAAHFQVTYCRELVNNYSI